MAAAGIVLAGGRSSRMGTQKAALAWPGGTLLARTVRVLAEASGGPVVVVRARDQVLPALPDLASGVLVVADPRPDLGPLQGIAAGLAALAGWPPARAQAGTGSGTAAAAAADVEVAFVAATDMPFLHPAFIARVLARLTATGPATGPAPGEPADVALPVARGYPQPLAAAYRVALAPVADALLAAGRTRPADLFAACAVTRLDEAWLLADPALAAADPGLDSLINVNDPAEYAAALARSAARSQPGPPPSRPRS